MPTLPVALAVKAARWFGRPATVTAVDVLAPTLRKVTFEGENLRGKPWAAGQEIEFHVAAGDFRHYTPSVFDRTAGHLEVIFSTRAGGPGSHWVANLSPGDTVGVMGPGGGVATLPAEPGTRLVLLGDITTAGLFHGLLTAAGPVDASGAVEVHPDDRNAVKHLLPGLHVLDAGDEPGSALTAWADRLDTPSSAPVRVLIAGHAQTAQRIRSLLRARGFGRRDVTVKAYWATGKTGL